MFLSPYALLHRSGNKVVMAGWMTVVMTRIVMMTSLAMVTFPPPSVISSPLSPPSLHRSHYSGSFSSQRKLKIEPSLCKGPAGEPGTCMFNFECYQKGGHVVGTCIDGFLFGACCDLPGGGEEGGEGGGGGVKVTGSKVPSSSSSSSSSSASMDDNLLAIQNVELEAETSLLVPLDGTPEESLSNGVSVGEDSVVGDAIDKLPSTLNAGNELGSFTGERIVPGIIGVSAPGQEALEEVVSVHYGPPSKTTTQELTFATEPSVAVSAGTQSTTETSSTTGVDALSTEPVSKFYDCGVRPLAREGRIVNGEKSDFAEWPWQALIKESTWLGIFTKNKCGGVLLNKKYVLTAAHCQPGFLASLIVVLGEWDLADDYEPKKTVQRNVKRVIVHKGYVAKTFDNDLALLEMERPVSFEEHIVPICMPHGDEDYTGMTGYVTGWGRLSYGGPVPTQLNEVQVPIIRNSQCQKWFLEAGHIKTIKSEFFCAGYKEGKRDSCEGDSGGPLSIQGDDGRWYLAGTVSHGIKCAYPNLPGVYMKMTYYKPWIESITG